MLAARTSAVVGRQLSAASSLAGSAQVWKTPSFAVGRTGGPLRLLEVSSLDALGVEPALDALLAG